MVHRGIAATGHLLVVDDNKVNRLLLGRGLEQQGHAVAFAENGVHALAMLRAQPFDLVLLDIQMPEMDGYQVLEQITSDLHLRDIPVIMTTATEELDSVVRCIEMGAEDYLTKPVNPVLLRARIGASLEKKRLRDQQRELVKKFATAEVAEDMQESGFALGGKFVEATAMFSDIRGFTTIAESQPPADTIELLNTYYTLMFEAISGHSGVVNQMVGDGLMAIFGAPLALDDRCEHAVRAAIEMIEMVELFNTDQTAQGKVQIRIGIGIASGQVIAGYTGTLRRATYTCVGDTVNLAARLEGHTKVVGQPILIDETTRLGLGSAIRVVDEGELQLKGKTQTVRVFSVPEGHKCP
jgi:adenylate cyclase